LKILERRDGDRWQRFRDEVKVMRAHRDHPGVLRLVAYRLPNSKEKPAWLATAEAETLVRAIGQDSELPAMVAAFAMYARTLADLAEEGISHRDIKPENLFRLTDAWVIGDFGLVDYPGKPAVTSPNRRLGPVFFIAPEMLADPDSADGNPADVFSLAKSLWAVATGNRYAPGGQIRAELPAHQMGTWFQDSPPGSLSLTVLLEQATTDEPADRPSIHEFAERLAAWPKQPRNADDLAGREIQRRAIDRLGALLATSLDAEGSDEVQGYLARTIPESIAKGATFRRQFQTAEAERVRSQRADYLANDGIKGVLHLCDTAWAGDLAAVTDFSGVILARPVAARDEQLFRGWQVLMGRPLWWMHIIALGGLLQLVKQDGCEPRASDMARAQIRRVLLAFPDEEIFAASFRLQRSLIPATARAVALAAPLIEQRANVLAGVLLAGEKLVYDASPANLSRIQVDTLVHQVIRQQDLFTVENLEKAAQDAEEALQRLPIPDIPWFGPAHDPWLENWAEVSPLRACGLAVLSRDPRGDAFVVADAEVWQAVVDASQSHSSVRQFAAQIVARVEHAGPAPPERDNVARPS
jgi:hypothetical protein